MPNNKTLQMGNYTISNNRRYAFTDPLSKERYRKRITEYLKPEQSWVFEHIIKQQYPDFYKKIRKTGGSKHTTNTYLGFFISYLDPSSDYFGSTTGILVQKHIDKFWKGNINPLELLFYHNIAEYCLEVTKEVDEYGFCFPKSSGTKDHHMFLAPGEHNRTSINPQDPLYNKLYAKDLFKCRPNMCRINLSEDTKKELLTYFIKKYKRAPLKENDRRGFVLPKNHPLRAFKGSFGYGKEKYSPSTFWRQFCTVNQHKSHKRIDYELLGTLSRYLVKGCGDLDISNENKQRVEFIKLCENGKNPYTMNKDWTTAFILKYLRPESPTYDMAFHEKVVKKFPDLVPKHWSYIATDRTAKKKLNTLYEILAHLKKNKDKSIKQILEEDTTQIIGKRYFKGAVADSFTTRGRDKNQGLSNFSTFIAEDIKNIQEVILDYRPDLLDILEMDKGSLILKKDTSATKEEILRIAKAGTKLSKKLTLSAITLASKQFNGEHDEFIQEIFKLRPDWNIQFGKPLIRIKTPGKQCVEDFQLRYEQMLKNKEKRVMKRWSPNTPSPADIYQLFYETNVDIKNVNAVTKWAGSKGYPTDKLAKRVYKNLHTYSNIIKNNNSKIIEVNGLDELLEYGKKNNIPFKDDDRRRLKQPGDKILYTTTEKVGYVLELVK